MKIEFTVGISASGKSRYGKDQFEAISGFPVERDVIRAMIQTYGCEFVIGHKALPELYQTTLVAETGVDWKAWKWKREKDVTKIQRDLLTTFAKGCHVPYGSFDKVIVCDTNLNPDRLKEFKSWALKQGYEVLPDVEFNVTLEEAWARDARRFNGVGHSVIFKQWLELEFAKNMPQIEAVIKNRKKIGVPSAVVFDIDGTLATAKTRDIYDWDRVIEDQPIEEIVNIAKLLIEAGTKIIVVSGRDAVCKEDTIKWLHSHGITFEHIFMRAEGDNRKDTIVKKEIYLRDILPKYKVTMVFDDRPSVVRMWQSMGIPTAALGYQHYEF